MNANALRRKADQAIATALAKRRFRQLAPGRFAREIAPGVDVWVGVGLASHKRGGEVDADPMVGVRNGAVEHLVGSGPGEATLFRPLYELMPDGGYRTWSFNEHDVDEQADALADAVTDIGIPAMADFASLEQLEAGLREFAFADIRRSRLPALLVTVGDRNAARRQIADELSRLQQLGDLPMAEEYEELAARILATRDS